MIEHVERMRVGWVDTDASGLIHYTAALRYPDEFECAARVAALGRSSVTYAYEIRRIEGVLAIVGKIVAVAVDPAGRTMPLPEELRAALAAAM